MRKIYLLLFSIVIGFCAKAQDLKYYLPDSVTYNPAIPKPADIIYHEVGEWHVTHDRLVNYMKAVAAAAPERVKMELMGFTYEKRPQVLLIITSPKNHQRLEEIRQQHLLLSDPAKSGSVDIENMPIVVYIGHSIHGNEPSGANASLLSAYYLAAAQGKQIDDLLEHVVILFDPSFNPDGLQRFSTWTNQHRSKNLVTDPYSREFNEVWPGGRFNHYWFDLNRDWLPAVHVESQNRLRWFYNWKPNILTDHHEQGSNASFFFQPGVPSRVNPLTPEKNQELTDKLGKYHAAFLDRIGSLYFTRENYDDFYYGKGSTFPDINGAIGILFEQASSRGHLQETANGLLSFPFTIKNQFTTTLSTLEGAKALRKEFLEWQRDFYKNSMKEAAADPVKGFIYGEKDDPSRTKLFTDLLQRQQVQVQKVNGNVAVNGKIFEGGSAYYVSLSQVQYKVIKTIFEKTLNYKDSLFYDITAWTMPLAFGLPYESVGAADVARVNPGAAVDANTMAMAGGLVTKSEYAYLVSWQDFYAPAALYSLLKKDVLVKAATAPFELMIGGQKKRFAAGTLMIPVKRQTVSAASLDTYLDEVIIKYGVHVDAAGTGESMVGIDLGSSRFVTLTLPSVALLTGPGVNATDAGEIWHLMDQRMNIPVTQLEPAIFNRADLTRYNTIIMVGGAYTELNKEKLKTWVQAGGVLVLTEEAVSWASQNGITDNKFKKLKQPVDSTARIPYNQREQIEGAQQMPGIILGADADLTNPLAFGYTQRTISLFKANKVYPEKSKNPYATPFFYGNDPLQSGWVSRENLDAIRNSAAVIVNTVGGGRVINIADNPNFRAFWLGGTRLFTNAIFFGRLIDAASGRTGGE
ncbi:MAG: zinc carboxypeptidase [Chitinophagaceae bacterium]|nr:zinc carboxypeptidase [Chitinophagaceae bacterium]